MKALNDLQELREQSQLISERIEKLELELKKPLRKDIDDNAVEEGSREVLNHLYKIEQENLAKIQADIIARELAV